MAGSATLTKSGSGTAILNGANSYSGLTTVTNGTLQLGPAAQSPVLNLGGADIQAGKIVFNYAGGSDPAAQIASILDTSYGNGFHPFTSGQIHSSTAVTAGLALGWKDDATAQAVSVMYTLYGDADLSGTVDFTDLNTVLSFYNKPGTWATGDFNYDGMVNLADLNSVLSFYNKSVPVVVDALDYNLDGESARCPIRRRHHRRARTWNPGHVGHKPIQHLRLCMEETKVSKQRTRSMNNG